MKEHLSRRMKKIEEYPGMKRNSREVKVIFINEGESEEAAFLREGVNPKNHSDVDVIVIRFVSPGDVVTPPLSDKAKDTSDLGPGSPRMAQDRISQGD